MPMDIGCYNFPVGFFGNIFIAIRTNKQHVLIFGINFFELPDQISDISSHSGFVPKSRVDSYSHAYSIRYEAQSIKGCNILIPNYTSVVSKEGRSYQDYKTGVETDQWKLSRDKAFEEGFANSSIAEINKIIDDICSEESAAYLNKRNKKTSVFHIYESVADRLPFFISRKANDKAIKAINNDDVDQSRAGSNAFIMMNLKTIVGAVRPFLTHDWDNNNDLMQYVLLETKEKSNLLKNEKTYCGNLNSIVNHLANKFVSEELGIPTYCVKDRLHNVLDRDLNEVLEKYPDGLDNNNMKKESIMVSEKHNIKESTVFDCLKLRDNKRTIANNYYRPQAQLFERLSREEEWDILGEYLLNLPDTELYVLRERYYNERYLKDIGKNLGCTDEWVRKLEERGIETLQRRLKRARGKLF
jgi:RNA polymerase sigma factor (sigma-70 family)